MPFNIPDKGVGADDAQSRLFSEYFSALVDGISGNNCVLSGLAATSNSNMTIAIAKGSVLSNGVMFAVAAANATITTADATNPRIDLIVITSAGAIAVRAGIPAAVPKPPARTANDVLIAQIFVPATDTNIATNQIVDLRVLRDNGPICIFRQGAVNTVNTSSSAIHLLDQANSGLSIPNGLLLAGRELRITIHGNMLLNSGTPTVRLIVSYGGTTMFSDISAASTLDTDRSPFSLNLSLKAINNASQALGGVAAMGKIAAKTAPTTGLGDAWDTAAVIAPIVGVAAVDSDAANRIIAVSLTLSVANAANEVVVNSATVELI